MVGGCRPVRSPVQRFLKIPSGKLGVPFILEPYERMIIELTFGFIDENEKRQFQYTLIEVARKNGKALSLDTEIPTPNGWRTMGEIHAGDYVFGRDGKPSKVIVESEVFDKPMYLVTFEDGATIKASADHIWTVQTKNSRNCVNRVPKIKNPNCDHSRLGKHIGNGKLYRSGGWYETTTAQMADDFVRVRRDGKGCEYKYRVPMNELVNYSEKILPIDPYVFGAWLGDGTSSKPQITIGHEDEDEMVRNLSLRGHLVTKHEYPSIIGRSASTYDIDHRVRDGKTGPFKQKLLDLGVLNNKHIPDVYLTASKRQRLELLAGLLDTDGCCSKSERKYHFSTTSEKLRDSFIALVSTFGWRVCVTESMPRPHKIQSGHEIVGRKMCYVIGFSPTEEIPCRVERKHLREFSKQRKIAIKSVRKVEPKRGNCIQVEGGVYCVGRTMLPTHNSTLEIFLLSGIIGWFPDMPNLASSFSGTMTKSLYDGVNQILTDVDEYAWHEIFPDVTFKAREGTNSKDQTINVGKRKRFKSLTCRAINASLTGNTRCEYLLCADDLCSGIEEALNKERLEKLWQTFNTDLLTRRKLGAKQLHIATRWSTLDVIGRLKAIHADDPRARFIAIPALDENGESNFDYDGGVGFNTAYFKEIQKSMDDISFKCLFQNEPVEREGLLYHDDELQRYLDLPLQEPDAVLSIVDTKNKGTDYFVQPVLLQYGDKYYCTDCICSDDSDYERQYARSTNLILTNKVEACQFESNNGGDRIALEVSKRVKEAKGYCNITQSFTTQNKETKIIVYAPWVKEHIIFKDRSMYNPNDDYGKMMSFLLGYSPMGKNKHDDVPDAFSSFAKWKNRPETPPTIVGRRPF